MKSALTILAALLFTPLAALPAADPTKPNVVFIMADDIGWGDLSRNGGVTTPWQKPSPGSSH